MFYVAGKEENFTMGELKISAVVPCKNESHRLTDCVESLKGFADEIIVVDDGSSDDTVELAKSLGCVVIEADRGDRPLEVLCKIGYEHVAGGWIVSLDADEWMTPSLAAALKQVAEEGRYSSACYARKNMIFGKWARYGGWFNNDQKRFFKADSWDRNWQCEIHLPPKIEGECYVLPLCEDNATIHNDYHCVSQFVGRTLVRYAKQEGEQAVEQGRSFSVIRLFLKPMKRFMGRYFVRQGFRDGFVGLYLAILLAGYDLIIEMNIWDKERLGDGYEVPKSVTKKTSLIKEETKVVAA